MKKLFVAGVGVLLCSTLTAHAQVINTDMKPNAAIDYSKLSHVDSVINDCFVLVLVFGVVSFVFLVFFFVFL